MSSLVSDFLINPILRQARRFSNPNNDQVDPLTNQRTPRLTLETRHEDVIDEVSERREGLPALHTHSSAGSESISGEPLVSSPIEEDGGGGLEAAEVSPFGHGRSPSAPAAFGSSRAVPLRFASLRSDPGHDDDDVTSNPSYGIPRPFRTSSAMSASNASHVILEARISPAEGPARQSTQEGVSHRIGTHRRNSSLPADDGMGELRHQIIHIQAMDVSPEEKARMMHQLLIQGYSQAQVISHAKSQPKEIPAPASMVSQERPTGPGSLGSFNFWPSNGPADASGQFERHTFHLSPDDLRRTYAPIEESLDLGEGGESGETSEDLSEKIPVLGCQHYKRNVKLQCSTCDRWYTCRLCHDEVEDHTLIRKATKNMLCMICGCAQRAGEFCVDCGERTAWYYCDVCKLWDNDSQKSIYHCNDCGICRKGRGLGKDFFHCKTCGVCMSMAVEHSHKCIERVSDCDCPICGEYMFTSPQPVVFMLCGHGIHQKCYYEHMKSSYKCPICSKSTVNMESQFRNLDRSIESQPMPPQFQDTKAMVSCNDCYAKSAVKYHWLGLKCAICDSYNTAQLSILSDPAVEVPVIESREVDAAIVAQPGLSALPSAVSGSGSGPIRVRRHSLHLHSSDASRGAGNRFFPYQIRQRIIRSASPPRGLGFLDDPRVDLMETYDSADEDDLDFWGRDEPRSVASAENIGIDIEEEEDGEFEDDSDSVMDDCDDDDEDSEQVDRFDLFGHR
ncbi:chy and ring finger domain-containing protein [Phlyctema vagabunda]|uniref:Chy and ring finger domain-containing protein n=1 Tax=Phlyctema vagabunda TaxID=108571 RepID=A0ABR4PH79_9HELO